MSDAWFNGVLAGKASWHRKERLVDRIADAPTLIALARASGAWPVSLGYEPLFSATGLPAQLRGLVAEYAPESGVARQLVGEVGSGYTHLDLAEWDATIRAAVEAGATPTGGFALHDGRLVLATFEVADANGEFKDYLILGDAFDRSRKRFALRAHERVVCANTLAIAWAEGAEGAVQLRHTRGINVREVGLRDAVVASVAEGHAIRDLYARAKSLHLSREQAQAAFDALFPAAPEGASKAQATRAEAQRDEAMVAMARPENREGERGNIATLWNGATWMIDRHADGSQRTTRGTAKATEAEQAQAAVDSMLFGSRRDRVTEVHEAIERLVEVIERDGTVRPMVVADAIRAGVAPEQAGALAWMLGE